MTQRLELCPFCGGLPRRFIMYRKPDAIICTVCGAMVKNIETWNMRVDTRKIARATGYIGNIEGAIVSDATT